MRFSDCNKELGFLNLDKKEKIITPYSYKMFCDGGSRNEGAAIGIIMYDKNDNIFLSHYEYIGITTCNVAEYLALYTGIKLLKEKRIKEVNIFMDSELVVKQMNKKWKCHNEHIARINRMSLSLLNEMKWTISWIPREKNKEADSLVNLAFKERNQYENN